MCTFLGGAQDRLTVRESALRTIGLLGGGSGTSGNRRKKGDQGLKILSNYDYVQQFWLDKAPKPYNPNITTLIQNNPNSAPLVCWYSYVSNKRACAFILFENIMHPCTVLFEPARLLILEEAILPACLSKLTPFWILLLVLSKKKVKSAEIAPKCCSNPAVATHDKF